MITSPHFGFLYFDLSDVIFSYIVGHTGMGVEEIGNPNVEFPSEDGELPGGV